MRATRLPLLILAMVLVAFGVAYLASESYLTQLAYLRKLPRATLDSPVEGPAIYRGRLYGPESRIGPATRKPAAVSMWWVITGSSKSRKRVCNERSLSELTLTSDDASIPLKSLDGNVSLVSDKNTVDWDHEKVIDTGKLAEYTTSKLPRHAASCPGSNPSYYELNIPSGAEVEVVACYSGEALRDCGKRPISAALAVPDLLTHRVRRADRAYLGFIVAAGLSIAFIGIVFIVGLVSFTRTSAPVRPS